MVLLYIGGGNDTQDAVVNFRRCIINAPHPEDAGNVQTTHGVTATYNNGYSAAKEVNFYECDIYGGYEQAFYYNFAEGSDNIGYTKFNLHSGTKVYHKDNTETWTAYTQPEVANLLNNWKGTTIPGSYTLVGNEFVMANCATKGVEGDEWAITDLRLTDDANVYDYR